MNTTNILTKTYPVSNFERVVLHAQHENHLTIIQGKQEALAIRAPVDVLSRTKAHVRNGVLDINQGGDWLERLRDALTTSLSRPEIYYTLRVEQLDSLEVYALATITAKYLKAKHLSLKFSGPGILEIEDLQAKQLEVELSGINRVKLAGSTDSQSIVMRGMTQYDAGLLMSKHTEIEMTGPGDLTVWVLEQLDVDVRGPGSVSYYGTPQIQKNLSPISRLTHLESTGVHA